jgi:hypothetical protein
MTIVIVALTLSISLPDSASRPIPGSLPAAGSLAFAFSLPPLSLLSLFTLTAHLPPFFGSGLPLLHSSSRGLGSARLGDRIPPPARAM